MKHGIVLLRKKMGMTSYDAIRELKKIFHTNKIGHAGTLDPFASGVLIVGINEGTKILPFIESEYKEYIAELTLGKETDTFDITGKVIKEQQCKVHDKLEIYNVFQSFIGEITQTPPKYSAIKVNGKPLYKYARENIEIKIKQRKQYIYELKLVDYCNDKIIFYAKVNKGTYIRSLGVDIAHKLNEIGYLSNLERIAIGEHKILASKKLECINENDIIPISESLNMPKIEYPNIDDIKNGRKIKLNINSPFVVIMNNNFPFAIYELHKDDMLYYCKRGFNYGSN